MRIVLAQGPAQLLNMIGVLRYLDSLDVQPAKLILYDFDLVSRAEYRVQMSAIIKTYSWASVDYQKSGTRQPLKKKKYTNFFLDDLRKTTSQLELVYSRIMHNHLAVAMLGSGLFQKSYEVGDSYGLVGENELNTIAHFDAVSKLKRLLKTLTRNFEAGVVLTSRLKKPDAYILFIPIIYAKLETSEVKKFIKPDPQILSNVFADARKNLKNLSQNYSDIVSKVMASDALLVFSNLAPSNICTENEEYESYYSILEELQYKFTSLTVKFHPRYNVSMAKKLSMRFPNIFFIHDSLTIVPVELLISRNFSGRVIVVCSTSPMVIKAILGVCCDEVEDHINVIPDVLKNHIIMRTKALNKRVEVGKL